MGNYTKFAIGVFAVFVALFVFLAGMLVERVSNGTLDPASFNRSTETQP